VIRKRRDPSVGHETQPGEDRFKAILCADQARRPRASAHTARAEKLDAFEPETGSRDQTAIPCGSPTGRIMLGFAKRACPLAVLAVLVSAGAPAKAQFADEGQMQRFAPVLEMMKQKMGKRRFGQLMQTMGPMIMQMEEQGGFSTLTGGDMPGIGGLDVGQMIGMVGPMTDLIAGRGGKGRRHRR
jgi:hypothetical protein